ncbi:MAG: hypothetical protein JW959_07345 [Pirellulales bacterium]|nr:hypothetical protein [Pirellulales bacterium]
MSRTSRVAGSFAIVIIAYWAYALTAVPWIEPTIDQQRAEGISRQQRDRASKIADEQLNRIRLLFPPGRMEALGLEKPVVLESNRAKLLFQTYVNQRDGGIALKPCVIVFNSDAPAEDETQRNRQAVILEAAGGAQLYFDPPLDVNRAKIGRLVRGRLDGPIAIRSGWKSPGPEDDLLIETRDLQLTERTVFTTQPVEFRWGANFGRGREMVIQLLVDRPQSGSDDAAMKITGIETFELCQIDRLHLDLGQALPNASEGKSPPESVPVEIKCRGPFRFDVQRRVASFHEQVEVIKLNPFGPPDRIDCDLLSMHFIERVAKKDAEPGSLDLVAERLECRGKPVVVAVPGRKLTARAPQIEYNLLTEAVAAAGPGQLCGQLDRSSNRLLEAEWNKSMRFYTHQRQRVICLDGPAALKHQDLGRLDAGEIFFWLDEAPAAAGEKQTRLTPDRMLARENVQLDSPRLSGKLDQLEVWFDDEGQEHGDRKTGAGKRLAGTAGATVELPPQQTHRVPPQQMTVEPPFQRVAEEINPIQQPPGKRFEVAGRLLQANLQIGGPRPGVSRLTVEDGVCFREVRDSTPGDAPLLVRGDKLSMENAAGANATVKVSGSPARFEAKGLGLSGSNINLDRGANRLWIDGPGRMDMPLPEKVLKHLHLDNGLLTVDWRGKMEFDGGVARFEESVVAAGPFQQWETEKLEVKMRRPINFADSRLPEQPQVEEISSPGSASIKNRSFDEQRRQKSFDRMEVFDIRINVQSGAFTAGGPGWLNSVHRGNVQLPGKKNGPNASKADQLNCLTVRFQDSIKGNLVQDNLVQRQATFLGQVRAAYAPVADWNAMIMTDDPDALGPEGKTLRCDRLSVVEMPTPTGNLRAVELTALGSAVIEGMIFKAEAHRITYAEAKDLLVLEGDGRSDAKLFQQLKAGNPQSRVAARKIKYWPKTRQWELIDARSMQIGRPPDNYRPVK